MHTTHNFSSAHEVWSSFTSTIELITPKSTNRVDFIAECNGGAFDGVVAIYRTFSSIAITGRLDDELLSALPKSVKVISHNGTYLIGRIHVVSPCWRISKF